MPATPSAVLPIVLLLASNVFMTFAWYGHLKFTDKPLWVVILASWGIALFEYCLAVPANRIGAEMYSTAQLKTMQEVITLVVFAGFSVLYLKESFTLNHLVGFALIAAAPSSCSRASVTAVVSEPPRRPGQAYGARLDALNFFLADVRDGLGPYLAIYLLTQHHWDEASIGIVMAIGGIAGIIAQTPAGALVDASRARMKLLIAAAVVVTIGSIVLPWQSSFASVAITTALTGAAGSIFAPGIAAITLGIMGPKAFARRIGRNEAWNHAGNAVAAGIAAATAYLFGPVVVFWLMAGLAVASIFTASTIPESAIDEDLARGLSADDAASGGQPAGLRTLLAIPGLGVFAAACVVFHFSNAAMLPWSARSSRLPTRSSARA